MERYVTGGKTVMFLTRCSYMLEPLKRALRERGLPFFNPYRQKRMDWNPLAHSKREASAVDRLLSFLKPRRDCGGAPWTGDDFRHWTTWLRTELDGVPEAIRKTRPQECVFRSKWATDSGKKWATDSASNWAADSGAM